MYLILDLNAKIIVPNLIEQKLWTMNSASQMFTGKSGKSDHLGWEYKHDHWTVCTDWTLKALKNWTLSYIQI